MNPAPPATIIVDIFVKVLYYVVMRKSILVFGDLAVLYLALILTLAIRYGVEYQRNFALHVWPFTIIFLIWLLIFYIANLYELSVVKNTVSFFSNYFSVLKTRRGGNNERRC